MKILVVNIIIKMCRNHTIQSTTAGVLKQISIGKYDRGLYIEEKRHQSSICGGILTLMILVTIITYLSIVLYTVFNRLEYKIDESSVIFKDSGIDSLTFGEIWDQLPDNFEFDLSSYYNYTSCKDITFSIQVDHI